MVQTAHGGKRMNPFYLIALVVAVVAWGVYLLTDGSPPD